MTRHCDAIWNSQCQHVYFGRNKISPIRFSTCCSGGRLKSKLRYPYCLSLARNKPLLKWKQIVIILTWTVTGSRPAAGTAGGIVLNSPAVVHSSFGVLFSVEAVIQSFGFQRLFLD